MIAINLRALTSYKKKKRLCDTKSMYKISTNQQCQFFVSLLKHWNNFYSYLAHLTHAMSIFVKPYNTSNYFIQVANCAQKGKHVVSR